MTLGDRAKDALLALFGMAYPRVDYFTTYRAKVVKQSGAKVDVIPDDSRIPQPSDVKIKYGLPGITATFQPGAYVQLGWENGDPSKPYVMVFDDGATVTKVVVKAQQCYLGDEAGAKALAFQDDLQNHTHNFTYNPGPGAPVTAATLIPTNPGAGTLATKAK